MAEPTRPDQLGAVQRALLEIRDLKARLAEARAAQSAPLAITGIALRFPGGVSTPEGLAELLWAGRDAIEPIPASRWDLSRYLDENPDAPGKMITRFGGFVSDVDRFDAEFFGIAPVEAASMDPQQRLMLEVAWEALERAGQAPTALSGSRTGVYLGISNNDYGRRIFSQPERIDPWYSPGNAYSVAAGRISYVLGLQGPSIAVDTACSSSLVALHLAAQGLRSGDCDIALVGGVNLILSPEMNINFSKARMMAPDGRCKTFDAAADGYVRGEGCAMLVVRRLDEALASGDRVLAVVRGTAVNQDGRSGGLTAPNGPAQEAVIRAALDAAGVEPRLVSYVEAHGTGTPLGDPIEMHALGAVLGAGRDPAQPVMVGSIKTNLGHLEAAAGIAGVIKVALALQARSIPPHLNFEKPNPFIEWDSLPVTIPTNATPWAPIQGRRIAGVSSFGFSGTNAHAILEEAPVAAAGERGSVDRCLLPLSARDPAALEKLAARYEELLPGDVDLGDVSFTAGAGRALFSHRLAVVGRTSAEVRGHLADWRAGRAPAAVMTGVAPATPVRIAFLYSGQGSQSPGMGRRLYETSPVFRAELDRCAESLAGSLDRPLLELILPADGQASPIEETRYAQPAMVAFQLALTALWRSWGIEPAVVMGHSLGELASVHAAGMLSRDDVLRVAAARGALAHGLPATGAMAVILADAERVTAALRRDGGAVSIAAFTGPTNTVISGERDAVHRVVAAMTAQGIEAKPLRIHFAAHSPMVDPIAASFGEVMSGVRWSSPRTALVSNLTGAVARPGEIASGDYWMRHMRQPVRFAESIGALPALGITHCIEIGPHPVLLGMGSDCLPGSSIHWLPSLRRDQDDWLELFTSLQDLFCSGAAVDWAGVHAGACRSRVVLPTYPFAGRRHWIETQHDAPATPAWEQVSRALDSQAAMGPLDLNASSYPAKWDALARFTAATAARTLAELGLFAEPGSRLTLSEVLERGGIGATYRHLVRRWLERLADDGLLRSDGDAYVAVRSLTPPPIAPLVAELDLLFRDNRPLLEYVRHCERLVTPVLTGRESPLETLFPGGSFGLAEQLYEHSTTMQYVNALAARALAAVASAMPAGQRLRVLEAGAGTGGTTAAVLAALAPERTAYWFTDVTDVFLDRARDRLGARAGMRFARLDLDQDPAAQGFAPGSMDVVLAANAGHACRDLRQTLAWLRTLLAPGGLLVLVESTTHLAWFDMTTGLIEGWQHFTDDLRVDDPLLPPDRWVRALHEAGFAQADCWPGAGTAAEHLGQHLVVAQAPGAATPGGASDAGAVAPAASAPGTGSAARDVPAVRDLLAAAMPSERLDILRDLVRQQVITVLRYDGAQPPGRGDRLMDLGFDSLMAVQLRNRLGAALGLTAPLPATLMFDHPTIDAIAAFLLSRFEGATAEAVPATTPQAPLAAGEVAAMSDAEIEALLLDRLGGS